MAKILLGLSHNEQDEICDLKKKKKLQFLLLSADIMAQDTWRKKRGQKFSLFSCNS